MYLEDQIPINLIECRTMKLEEYQGALGTHVSAEG